MQKCKIHKYELSFESRTFVRMPEKSEIMDIQVQDGKPVMWAMVDPDSREIVVRIKTYMEENNYPKGKISSMLSGITKFNFAYIDSTHVEIFPEARHH